jgi:radical SAM superfamily enzyme YgiQ (UPF0313 family)
LEAYGLEILSAVLARQLPAVSQRLFAHISFFWDPSDQRETTRVVDRLFDQLRDYQPDICCFSTFTDTCNSMVRLAERLKAHDPSMVTLFGGIHATLRAAALLEEHPSIDYSLIGEAERTFPAFLQDLLEGRDHGSDIPGLIRRDGERITAIPVAPGPGDLDGLPFADKSLFAPFMPEVFEHFGTLTGRGCPYDCTYCASPFLRDLHGGREFLRRRSPRNIIEELLPHRDRIREVIFMDDVFTSSTAVLEGFLPLYKDRIGKPFICYSGPNNLSERKVELLADAGCVRVGIGIQSGSERLRRETFHRRGTNRQIEQAIALVQRSGMTASADLILGVPYESEQDRQETLRLLLRTRPDLLQLLYLTYYPGLAISQMAVDDGHLTHDEFLQIEAGTFQKSYYVGSHLKGAKLKQARRQGLMCHLTILLPRWLAGWLVRRRVHRWFPSGLFWHQACYALNAIRRGQRLHLLRRIVGEKLGFLRFDTKPG